MFELRREKRTDQREVGESTVDQALREQFGNMQFLRQVGGKQRLRRRHGPAKVHFSRICLTCCERPAEKRCGLTVAGVNLTPPSLRSQGRSASGTLAAR